MIQIESMKVEREKRHCRKFFRGKPFQGSHLEDHLMTCKCLITMVRFLPLARFDLLMNGL